MTGVRLINFNGGKLSSGNLWFIKWLLVYTGKIKTTTCCKNTAKNFFTLVTKDDSSPFSLSSVRFVLANDRRQTYKL
jgi:hypothetical protein